ncbi:hypothetical protein C9J01_10865 [Photobacterium rosenbergii]|uniref:Uncharacterized protein n=1 Tax=Photobacterium rosenbergii TaxID=294936 RepID=A0A2T3NFL1_9GAMM|nr:hypothetical protein [Photobacterium rosenbergii]PSW13340.1 hypothetical protein C9J01_10865 [Photobacterium rosenbergii]
MIKPIINSEFMQFYNCQMEEKQAIEYGYKLLSSLDNIADQIKLEVGEEGLELLTSYHSTRWALLRYLSYLEQSNQMLTVLDAEIFATYLFTNLRDFEQLIDEEFSEYGF